MKHKIVNKINGNVINEGFPTKYVAEETLADMAKTDKGWTEHLISVPSHWVWRYSFRNNGYKWMGRTYQFDNQN